MCLTYCFDTFICSILSTEHFDSENGPVRAEFMKWQLLIIETKQQMNKNIILYISLLNLLSVSVTERSDAYRSRGGSTRSLISSFKNLPSVSV